MRKKSPHRSARSASAPLQVSRRGFLQAGSLAAAAFAVPTIIPASALGRDGATAPSERIVMGAIGCGGKGRHNSQTFRGQPDVQFVAVCDVDAARVVQGKGEIDQAYGNQDCAAYGDFRELLARDDLDAVHVSTPDHWHALASIAALDRKLDVYCEKPLANSVGEGRAMVRAAERNGRILQCGSQERSNPSVRRGCELVRAGKLGELREIQINLPTDEGHHQKVKDWRGVPSPSPVPEGFDYNFWLGHTPEVPYVPERCHFWWRFILAYGGGEMTDRGAHIIDLAQLGADKDHTGPVRFTAKGTRQADSLYDAFMEYEFVNEYADGLKLIGRSAGPRGLRFVGSEGSLMIHIHGGKLEADPASILDADLGDKTDFLGRTPSHQRNFLDCVKSREKPFATVEIGHRTASLCHLNNLAMLVGRPLEWDPETERITNDEEANALLTPAMRKPWTLES